MNLRCKSLVLLVLMLCSVAISACRPGATPEPVTVVITSTPEETTPAAAPTQPPTVTTAPESTATEPTADSDLKTATSTALSVAQSAEGAWGLAHLLQVSIRTKDEPGLRVGILQSEVEGTGPMWRASGWSAVTLASLLLGINPEHFEFSIDPGTGRIDGPSAGGVTTVTVLAALLGDSVRDDAAMTGTINPDGTIGPVGGIPHKIDGAAEAGKTLVLVPAGQRYDYNINLEEEVDLVDWGNDVGVEVRLVGNIFDAYEILTGKPLPRPEPAHSPELPPLAYDRLKASTQGWLGRYLEAVNRFNSLSDEARRDREPEYGYEQYQLADDALKQGLVALAHQRAWEAALDAETSLQAAALDEAYYQHGIDGMLDQFYAAATSEEKLDAVLGQLVAERPRTASEAISLADAWSNLAEAQSLIFQAEDLWARIQQNRGEAEEDQIRDWIYEAAYLFTQADVYLDLAGGAADLGRGFGHTAAPDADQIHTVAELLRRAADANIALFESTTLQNSVDQTGYSMDVVRQIWMDWEPSYASAVMASSWWGNYWLQEQTDDEMAQALANLGAALTAWGESASLIAKYYSLGAELDDDGNVTGLAGESVLLEMLDLAADRADELTALVADEEPVAPLGYNEVARVWRHGTPEEQLLALYYFWQAAIESQVLAYLTGDYGEAIMAELEKSGRPLQDLDYWDFSGE